MTIIKRTLSGPTAFLSLEPEEMIKARQPQEPDSRSILAKTYDQGYDEGYQSGRQIAMLIQDEHFQRGVESVKSRSPPIPFFLGWLLGTATLLLLHWIVN